jgi:hypothetical protein
VLITIGGLALAAGSVYHRADQARGHLAAAADLVQELQQELRAGKRVDARATLAAIQRETAAARAAGRDSLWRLGGHLPRLGANLHAVDTVATVLDGLARDGLLPLVEVAATLDPARFASVRGLDLTAVARAAPTIKRARAAFLDARARLAAIPTDGLVAQVRGAIAEMRSGLDRALPTIETAVRVTALLPPMLGIHGKRTYLILFQNPAEIRATGGMPGAFAVVRADRGRVRIVQFGTAAADLRSFDRSVLPLGRAMRRLHGDKPGIYPADINLSPHFPTAARLAREMYRLRSGVTVDGVIATDPVALSYLLRATGPVRVAGGARLTAANAVRVLLSDVYQRIESHMAQDLFYREAARTVFETVFRGLVAPRVALAAVARAAGERRLLVWSARPREEQLLAGTVLAGALPDRDGDRPTVGVFLNDGSGAKLDYYLTHTARLWETCPIDGRRELRLRVVLRSTAPRSGLSESVLGLGLAGDPYTIRTNLMIFSPTGGDVVGARRDGVRTSWAVGAERGRTVGTVTVDLPPGDRRTLDFTLLTDVMPGPAPWPSARMEGTPGLTRWNLGIKAPEQC